LKKRDNATEWESKSIGCVEYQCINDTEEISKTEHCEEKECQNSKCNDINGQFDYEPTDEWKEAIKQENHCYEVVCEDNKPVVKKRYNATQWENRTNGCVEYQCDNSTGPITKIICESSDAVNRFCINDQCVENKEIVNNKVAVEITLADGVNIAEMSTEAVLEVLAETLSIETKDVIVEWEMNEEGNVIRMIVYVSDEETASLIATTIDEVKDDDDCQYGILCKAKEVLLVTDESGSQNLHNIINTLLIIVSMTVIEMIVYG